MTITKLFLIGSFACVGIFLFVSAPPQLPEAQGRIQGESEVGVRSLFDTVNAINEAARFVYTKRIVGAGKAAGLKFGEDWNEPEVEKGPLPALFLRLVARQMERKPQPLGLYLGSDEPINKSNLFSDDQMKQFENVKANQSPKFSISETSRSVAMYPDFASAKPCVSCHNEHKDSPKTDWKMGDVMGATTWTYPQASVSESEHLIVSKALFAAVSESYELYLTKTQSFENPVEIGDGWPESGNRILPSAEIFMRAVLEESGAFVASEILTAKLEEKKQ